jgi:hypothetical protein
MRTSIVPRSAATFLKLLAVLLEPGDLDEVGPRTNDDQDLLAVHGE